MLTHLNGQPIESTPQVTLTTDQVGAVAAQLIDAQISWLFHNGVSPKLVVEMLMEFSANILSGMEPAAERKTVVQDLTFKFDKAVAEKARARVLATFVPPAGGPT